MRALLCWERREVNSWNPVLARMLRERGLEVTEACDLAELAEHDPAGFEVVLPRFRAGAADMACLDELLVRSRVPMLNSRECRQTCENKALAHLAFERNGLPQPPSVVVSREGVVDRAPGWSGETVVKPLHGCRGFGIEVRPDVEQAIERARMRREDLLVQQMVWPARCWRVIVGRTVGVVDPYWRRPPTPADRILSISTGSTIARDDLSPEGEAVARRMLTAVAGDLLAVDLLETADGVLALEINHNFDAHGGDEPAAAAFKAEIDAVAGHGTREHRRRGLHNSPAHVTST
jgi:glutathione synthase/RimK-type ligase-like ATP-grasp enzyme